MKKEYKVTRHIAETTEEEKEEIYQKLADIFIRMALKEKENDRKKVKDERVWSRLFKKWKWKIKTKN